MRTRVSVLLHLDGIIEAARQARAVSELKIGKMSKVLSTKCLMHRLKKLVMGKALSRNTIFGPSYLFDEPETFNIQLEDF